MASEMGRSPAGFLKFKEYIFSTRLEKVKSGVVLFREKVKEQVSKIKMEKGISFSLGL